MMKFVVLAAFVAVAYARSVEVDEPGSWKIVGGANAVSGQFPYIVSIRRPSSHSCGGSIINENWILTAAHCTTGAAVSSIKIVAGAHLLNSGGTTYDVTVNAVHSGYNPNTIANDIALLKLSRPLTWSSLVAPVPLATATTGGGAAAVLCGWGRVVTGGAIPNNLQFINLVTQTVSQCQSAHGSNPVYDTQICTLTRSGEGACNGDSGGPLTDASGRQIGIVSWGMPCARGYPDVYTRVTSFNSWIQTTMNNN